MVRPTLPAHIKMQSSKVIVFAALILYLSVGCLYAQLPGRAGPESIYSFVMKDIEGNDVHLSKFRGKVLLIVNVASECGFTDNHYKELVELHNTLPSEQFSILAFPCNQFGGQEPKRNSAISLFIKNEYGVEFPMFSKIKISGKEAHPLYIWLYRQSGYYPDWNFCKYLIDKGGKIRQFADSHTSPLQLLTNIKTLINGGSLGSGERKGDEL